MVMWRSHKSNFTASARVTILHDEFERHTFNITVYILYMVGVNK